MTSAADRLTITTVTGELCARLTVEEQKRECLLYDIHYWKVWRAGFQPNVKSGSSGIEETGPRAWPQTVVPAKQRTKLAKRKGVAREKLEKQRGKEFAKMERDQKWLDELDDNNLNREPMMQHHAKEKFTFRSTAVRNLQQLEKDISSEKTAPHKSRQPVNAIMKQDILGHYALEGSVKGISNKTANKFQGERTNNGFTQSLRLGRPSIASNVTRSMNRVERLVASGRRNFKDSGATLYEPDNPVLADQSRKMVLRKDGGLSGANVVQVASPETGIFTAATGPRSAPTILAKTAPAAVESNRNAARR
jgi:hypothetical protein